MYSVYEISAGTEKKYIGCTGNVKERFNCHMKRASKISIHKSPLYEEYKKTNVLHLKIISTHTTKLNAWKAETKAIEEMNTVWPNGFNLARAGRGGGGEKNKRAIQDQFGNIYESIRAAAKKIGKKPSDVWKTLGAYQGRTQIGGYRFKYL